VVTTLDYIEPGLEVTVEDDCGVFRSDAVVVAPSKRYCAAPCRIDSRRRARRDAIESFGNTTLSMFVSGAEGASVGDDSALFAGRLAMLRNE
jgi:hypothetical protein